MLFGSRINHDKTSKPDRRAVLAVIGMRGSNRMSRPHRPTLSRRCDRDL